MPSRSSIAHGSEPSAPAFDTAIASALPCTPAIGAWMIGRSMFRRLVERSWRSVLEVAPPPLKLRRDKSAVALRASARQVHLRLSSFGATSPLPPTSYDATSLPSLGVTGQVQAAFVSQVNGPDRVDFIASPVRTPPACRLGDEPNTNSLSWPLWARHRSAMFSTVVGPPRANGTT